MFFRYNQSETREFDSDSQEDALIKFFQKQNQEELTRYANEISPSAKQLFDGSVQSLLGQMPDEICQTTITINKDTLKQLLFSSMATGYIAKTVENRMHLEKYWDNDKKEPEEFSLEKQVNKAIAEDDNMDGIL